MGSLFLANHNPLPCALREGYSRGWGCGVNDHPGWESQIHVASSKIVPFLIGREEKSHLGIKELKTKHTASFRFWIQSYSGKNITSWKILHFSHAMMHFTSFHSTKVVGLSSSLSAPKICAVKEMLRRCNMTSNRS
ncbi:hypothetical protein AVEN_45121-1 [Araneus ventricosus]|uniref:Uncharacterized protein n=1 Tax=Araneus ventricosus TaxID=182803 RepID=A0A4Y2MJ56_ARAVE|nr:hypothetical protein AVEN_45121-1 [Araneus ventricosus]